MNGLASGSPAHPLERLGIETGLDLRVKRDDLLPMPGGGNKVRKVLRIVEEARSRGCNALITTGGAQSNHARVTALVAASLGWRCRLVLHGSPDALARPCGNLLLMLLAGAEVVVVQPDQIAAAMDAATRDLRAQGLIPFEIPGGGHSLAGALAYVDAVSELADQCGAWVPGYIVLPSGTGATQAGIVVGCRQQGWTTRVLGISVARQNPRGSEVVRASVEEAARHSGVCALASDVEFRDEWVGEGYEHADPRVLAVIREVARREGLPLDPTYTGKAFTGLLDLARSGEIPAGSRVLFWHTGGLLNLVSSDYFDSVTLS